MNVEYSSIHAWHFPEDFHRDLTTQVWNAPLMHDKHYLAYFSYAFLFWDKSLLCYTGYPQHYSTNLASQGIKVHAIISSSLSNVNNVK